MNQNPAALFLSHGGGPLPLLGDAGHREMCACLENIATDIPRPHALVVISAHWEENIPTITAGSSPPLIYDYYGFPPASYEIEYPCAGHPALAEKIHRLLGDSGIASRLDERRGFDHGMFVPLAIMYPEADIPCVQLSLVNSLDPSDHIAIGEALRDLHQENILVIGSGFSFHNLREFFAADTKESRHNNRAFEEWLQDTCCNPAYPEEERARLFTRWADAPGARFCHPREEHLLPLHVCYGVGQAACSDSFSLHIMNKQASMYLW